jgi:hypothetical protein
MIKRLIFILAVFFIIIAGSDRWDKNHASGHHIPYHSHILSSLSYYVPEISLSQKKLFTWTKILSPVRESIIGNYDSNTNDLSATVLKLYQTKVIDLKPLTRKQFRSLRPIPENEDDHNLS